MEVGAAAEEEELLLGCIEPTWPPLLLLFAERSTASAHVRARAEER
jgi:hypothetical protein